MENGTPIPELLTSDDPLTRSGIGAAIEVHKVLGPGLLESAYRSCLAHELSVLGVPYKIEVNLPVMYKNVRLGCGYRMDLVIADTLIVEIKAVEKLLPIIKHSY